MIKVTFSVTSIIAIYYFCSYCFLSTEKPCIKENNKSILINIKDTYLINESKLVNKPLIIKDRTLINESKKNMQLVVYKPRHLIPFKNYNEWIII